MAKRSVLPVALAALLPAVLLPAAVLLPSGSTATAAARGGTAGGGPAASGSAAASASAANAFSRTTFTVPDAGASDPTNTTALSEARAICLQGNALYFAGDYPGALNAYREAQRRSPKDPIPYYLAAEAHIALGNLEEADSALKVAEANTDRRTALLRSKVLFVVADLKERQKKWDEARAAWQAYHDWVMQTVQGGGTFPMSAMARMKVTDDAMKREQAMAIVRERIAASASGNVFNEVAGAAPKN